MSFNFTPNQAAQGANYAGRAMNAFQTAVNIDSQQPQTPGTTLWFRWFIRVVAVVTGIRKIEKNKLQQFFFFLFCSCDDLWNLRSIEYITTLHHCRCSNDVRLFFEERERFRLIFLVFLALH